MVDDIEGTAGTETLIGAAAGTMAGTTGAGTVGGVINGGTCKGGTVTTAGRFGKNRMVEGISPAIASAPPLVDILGGKGVVAVGPGITTTGFGISSDPKGIGIGAGGKIAADTT